MKDRILVIILVILAAGAGWYGWLSRPSSVAEGTYLIFSKDTMLSMGADFFPSWTSDLYRWKLGSTEAPVLISERQQIPGINGCGPDSMWTTVPTFDGASIDQQAGVIRTNYSSAAVGCLNGFEDMKLDGSSVVYGADVYQPKQTSADGSVEFTMQAGTSPVESDDMTFRLQDASGKVLRDRSMRVRTAPYDSYETSCGPPLISDDGERMYFSCGATFARYEWKTDVLTRFENVNLLFQRITSVDLTKELALVYGSIPADTSTVPNGGPQSGSIYLLNMKTGEMTFVNDWSGQPMDDAFGRGQEPWLAPDDQHYFQWNRIIAFNQNPDEAPHTVSGRLEDWVGDWMIFDRGNVLSAYNTTNGQIVNLAQAVGNDRDPDAVSYNYIGSLMTN